jgi:hypothetical protein
MTTVGLVFSAIGYIGGCVTVFGLVYKGYVFRKLKREGKLNPEMMSTNVGAVKVFFAVFFYGEYGKHIVSDGMESSLLNDDPRESFVELGDRRASMDTFLADAGLSRVADALERNGMYETCHLLDMDEADMDAAGLRRGEKKRLRRAQEQLIAAKSNNGTEENEAEDVD